MKSPTVQEQCVIHYATNLIPNRRDGVRSLGNR